MMKCATMIIVILAAMLTACATHTRYYSTDGTRTTEIERTMHIGSPLQSDDPDKGATQ